MSDMVCHLFLCFAEALVSNSLLLVDGMIRCLWPFLLSSACNAGDVYTLQFRWYHTDSIGFMDETFWINWFVCSDKFMASDFISWNNIQLWPLIEKQVEALATRIGSEELYPVSPLLDRE